MILYLATMTPEQRRAAQLEAMRAIHPDMDESKAYGGIDRLWVKPPNHPFNRFYQWHDIQYDLARIGLIKGPSSEGVDLSLLKLCLDEADRIYHAQLPETGSSFVALMQLEVYYAWLVSEAYLDHLACGLWGEWRWPEAAKA